MSKKTKITSRSNQGLLSSATNSNLLAGKQTDFTHKELNK